MTFFGPSSFEIRYRGVMPSDHAHLTWIPSAEKDALEVRIILDIKKYRYNVEES
jgi:hypothetical protein